MATTKLMLKIGLEAIYQSQKSVYHNNDFSELKKHLNKVENAPWPIVTTSEKLLDYKSIPRFSDKFNLNKFRCKLLYKVLDPNTFLFSFKYGVLTYIVNLKSRSHDWAEEIFKNDSVASIFPEHLQKKYNPLRPSY